MGVLYYWSIAALLMMSKPLSNNFLSGRQRFFSRLRYSNIFRQKDENVCTLAGILLEYCI
jgi:hypothetical protein